MTQERSENIIDIRDAAKAVWRGKWFVLLVTIATLSNGLWRLHNVDTIYEVSMLVMPNNEENKISFGGGILGEIQKSSETTPFDRFEIILGSYALAKRLQDKYGLLQLIYGEQWDSVNQRWIEPRDESFERTQRIRAFFNLRTWSAPSLETLANYVRSTINVSKVRETSIRKISLSSADPKFGETLLEIIYNEAVDLIREQDRQNFLAQRSYLLEQLDKVTTQSNKNVLIDILKSIERNLMLIDNGSNYLGQVVEEIRGSELRVFPDVNKIVYYPTIVVFFISIILATAFYLFKKEGLSKVGR